MLVMKGRCVSKSSTRRSASASKQRRHTMLEMDWMTSSADVSLLSSGYTGSTMPTAKQAVKRAKDAGMINGFIRELQGGQGFGVGRAPDGARPPTQEVGKSPSKGGSS